MGSLDFVVLSFLVPESILVEPVVDFCLSVNGITEIRRPRGSNPELWLFRNQQIIDELVLALIIFLDDAKISHCLA